MSIWDYMKPAAQSVSASDVALDGPRTLLVTWSDGSRTPLPARLLRQQCPCAACVDEWTHQRTLKPETVPADISIQELRPTGNYAVQLAFSDGHSTGIFTWVYLRELTAKSVLGT
ncbi:MAG: DUF971 domain-containing protein [Deltaproteobacteria bacterium]|nr:DUF971 domain-containing protein [Deltaproteobacteria bacterium]